MQKDISGIGLLVLAMAPNYGTLLLGAALVGTGSSIFHPESSRVARMASGGQHGLAQSIFQVGGNTGSAMGPLLAAWIFNPRGLNSPCYKCCDSERLDKLFDSHRPTN